MTEPESLERLFEQAARTHGFEIVLAALRNTLARLAAGETWIEVRPEFTSNVARLVLVGRQAVESLDCLELASGNPSIAELREVLRLFADVSAT